MAAAPVRAGDVEIAVVVGGPLGIWIAFRILVDEPDYLSWIDNCPFDRKELRIFLLVVNDETGGERRRFRGAGGAADIGPGIRVLFVFLAECAFRCCGF